MVSGNEAFKQRYEILKRTLVSNSRIARFVKDLRNSNNHIWILEAAPHYSIKFGLAAGTTEVNSGLRFNRNMILNGSGWSSESKSIAQEKEYLDTLELVREHFELATRFNNVVFVRTGIQSDPQYRDYERIKIARKTLGHQFSLNLGLQGAIRTNANPYEHLRDWFTEDEIARIYCFPNHSKEQLEYIISLRDPLGLCNDSARDGLYELFFCASR